MERGRGENRREGRKEADDKIFRGKESAELAREISFKTIIVFVQILK